VIEFAGNCKRTDVVKQYDKLRAAQHQLEGAIASLFLGNWPAAITLAGAAEEILPLRESKPDFLSTLQASFSSREGLTESEVNSMLNEKRNWLKHKTESLSTSQGFSQADAVFMILRALSRYSAYEEPPKNGEVINQAMSVFYDWFTAQYRGQTGKAPDKDKS
jgi:hypothetical protein